MKTSQHENAILREAAALADAVHDHAHFGEMVAALRHAEHAVKRRKMALPEGVTVEEALARMKRGRLVIALALELWVEKRA